MLTWGDAGWRINENPTHYLCNIFVYVKSEIFQNKTLKFLKNISPYGYYCRTWRLLRKPPKGNRKSLTNCKMCHLGQQSPKQQIHLCGGHPPAPRPTRGSLWITCSIEAGGVGGGGEGRGVDKQGDNAPAEETTAKMRTRINSAPGQWTSDHP